MSLLERSLFSLIAYDYYCNNIVFFYYLAVIGRRSLL